MAQKKIVIYTDDLTGTESGEVNTHTFALDGVNYEIDLTPESYDKLYEALSPFIEAGRKTGRTVRAGLRSRHAEGGASAENMRAWAKENGLKVNPRGRVPARVKQAYEEAH